MSKKIFLFLLVIVSLSLCVSACTDPAEGTITEDTEFCKLNYTINFTTLGITLGADDIILDCGGNTFNGDLKNINGITVSGRHNVTVKNCNMERYRKGIYVYQTTGSQFINDTLNFNTMYGIHVHESGNNVFADITANTNNNFGLYLDLGGFNVVNGLHASGNYEGIALGSSDDNNITGSVITGNTNNIRAYDSSRNLIQGNTLDSASWAGIKLFAYGVGTYSSENVIEGNDITNSYFGIRVETSNNDVIQSNVLTDNAYDIILLENSANIDIIGNTVQVSPGKGSSGMDYDIRDILKELRKPDIISQQKRILDRFFRNPDSNTLLKKVVRSKELKDASGMMGIVVLDSGSITVSGNNITGGTDYGIVVSECTGTAISANAVMSNQHAGLYHELSDSSQIMWNELTDNSEGIHFFDTGPSNIVRFNQMYNNIDYNFYNEQPDDVNATYNYWGTPYNDLINASIYDFYDNASLGIIFFVPTWDPDPGECNDGVDNDGDTFVDMDDPGCSNPLDPSEHNPAIQCDNGIDDDVDTFTDWPQDSGCESPLDNDEQTTQFECDNGIDDDGDGFIDYPDDDGCSSTWDDSEVGCIDSDGDGYGLNDNPDCTYVGIDCNDLNASINPSMTEIPYNGADDDCNNATLDDDLDQDGYVFADDCNDANASINPGETETPYNGVDDDCNNTTPDDDLDEDGFLLINDCDDLNASINPDATEICDGVDNDCDGMTDNLTRLTGQPGQCINNTETCIAGTWTPNNEYTPIDEICNSLDDDCDGTPDSFIRNCSVEHYGICAVGNETCTAGEWDDGCPEPMLVEYCYDDDVDEDCDGDAYNGCNCTDGETRNCLLQYGVCAGAFETCTDGTWPGCTDADYGGFYEPGTELTCDGLDNDCNNLIDDILTPPSCDLQDGVCAGSVKVCDGELGWLDCTADNYGPDYEAGTELTCDGLDNDCNNLIDDILTPPSCDLQDGVCAGSVKVCDGELGWLDCTADNYGPDYEADEISCDNLDNDCDSQTDEDIYNQTGSTDIGECSYGLDICVAGNWTINITPIYPENESCDGLDNDCDAAYDEDFDVDNDTYSTCGTNSTSGEQVQPDCDDNDYSINPGMPETPYNGVDDDCNPATLDDDLDQDGYNHTVDCDDNNASINPGAEEICDGVDNDCNGEIDNMTQDCSVAHYGICALGSETCIEGVWNGCPDPINETNIVYCDGLDNDCDSMFDEAFDQDADVYTICGTNTSDGSFIGIDCNDQDPTINPGMPEEYYNGKDDDCNNETRDYDQDHDDFYLWDDCNDEDPLINPNATEICNGIDDDCNNLTDDNLVPELCPLQDGVCAGSTKICGGEQGWLDCNETTYAEYSTDYQTLETSCDSLDNDCDGIIDQMQQECSQDYYGICSIGNETCNEGVWEGCPLPANELCNDDGLDEDCDGTVNEPEVCSCINDQTQPCPLQDGVCAGAFETCTEGQWPGCTADNYGPFYEETEISCDNLDNDCNGQTDDNLTPEPCNLQQGVCAGSTKICDGINGWLDCTEADYTNHNTNYEALEISCDNLDNDCEGTIDSFTQDCSLNYQGICAIGTETCNAGEWQGCPLPQEEACNNQDDNCDGIIDNITQSTNEQGLCFINTETCIEGTWTPNNEYTPQEETCNNLDDDCDGTTDNMTQDCSVQHLGVCALGTELCTEGTWDGCPLPQTEICDLESQDEDCDGQINEENSTDCTTYYHDEDSDTWGLELDNRCLCAPLDPYDSTQFEDCNDTNPDVNLDATEACNGIDDDCDGNIDEENATGCSIYYYDEDSDTWGLQEDNRCLCGPEAEYSSTQYQDCDDTNPGINPGMPEIYYNFLDDDCNASTIDWDKDSDGYPAPPFGTDCNDNDPNINPGMPEIPGNGIDDDCNASTGDYDVDGDGYEGCYPYYCGDDCDDNNASINPGAAEICDNVDNDCDGVIDNITQSTNELGECIINTETCIAGNWTPNNEYSITDEICNNLDDDCDGTIDMITQDCSVQHLGICALGTELCTEGSWDGCPIPEEELCNDDGLDEDCDGNINEPEICSCLNGQTQPCPFQYGVCVGAFETCTEGQWPGCTADNYGPDYEAGTELTCDGLDNDCDVAIDENITNQTGSTDVGECSFGLDVCIAGNWTVNITPIYPENEICDGLDNDCNNLTDDDLVPELCLLQDGVCAGSTKVCGGELGWLDCTADNYGPDYEAGTETSCDSLDNDCDGTVDMMIQECSLNYQGICAEGNETCTLGLWFGCPAPQTEICDGTLDEDCDGTIDEPNATNCLEYYYDGDSDTWGLGLDNRCLCAPEDPYDSTQFEDCDDANPEVNPDATETCNGIDDDCDTLVDEENATGCLVYYYDGDNDTWGLELDNKCLCTPQDQYTSNQTQDCDDTDASINPEATEICDGVDNDCDFMTDNITQPCSLQDGVCTGAFETCTDGSWPGCTDADYGLDYEPGTEVSCDNLDNDCDSQTDEDLYQDVACGQDECNGLVTQQCLDSDYQDIGNCSSYSNPCRVDDNYSIYGCYAGTDFDDDTYKEDHYFLCNEIGICTDYAHDWQLDEECNTTQYCWYSVDDGSDNYYCQDNKCPDFTSVPLTQAIVYTPYDYTAVADDPEDSVLTYSLDLIPVGTSMMSIDPATGVIDWTPSPDQINSYNLAADNSVTVRVDDGMCSVTQEFEITVHGICSEDDGGIKYFTKGRVNGTGCYAGDCMDYDTSDWCNGPDVLIEFYCSNGDLKSTEKNCINGCEDGACNIEPYCDDTDGGSDYFEFGIVSYDGIDYEDVCNGSTLTEYYCSNDMMNYDFYVCENGCSDGACQLMKAQDLQKNRIR